MYQINKNVSTRIISLRFILVFMVVLGHTTAMTGINVADNVQYPSPYLVRIQHFTKLIVWTVSLPLFYLISGFLLYTKETKFITVLKKKIHSILLPYLVWTILAVLFFYIVQSFDFTRVYFSTPRTIIRQFKILDWIDVFWGKLTPMAQGFPLVGQFWFLRDLFILNIISLGIKRLIDKFPFGYFVLCIVLWMTNASIYFVNPMALLFFSLGYYIVKYALNIESIDNVKIIEIVPIYVVTLFIELFFERYVQLMHQINTLMGCLFWLKLSYYLVTNIKLYKILERLEKYAFFVFAIHLPYLTVLRKLVARFIPMSGYGVFIQYICLTIFGTMLCLIIGIIVKKIFPGIFAIATGGRI